VKFRKIAPVLDSIFIIRHLYFPKEMSLLYAGGTEQIIPTKNVWWWRNFNFCVRTGLILMLTVASPLTYIYGIQDVNVWDIKPNSLSFLLWCSEQFILPRYTVEAKIFVGQASTLMFVRLSVTSLFCDRTSKYPSALVWSDK
jgi:hypothetical protein